MDNSIKEILRNIVDHLVPAHQLLGITLVDVRPGWVCLAMPFKPELVGDPRSQRLHGGLLSALLDSAGGAAAITTLTGPEDMVSSIDMRTDFLEPGRPELVHAEAEIIRSGSAILVTNMRAFHPASGTVLAEGRGVYRVRRMADHQNGIDPSKLDLSGSPG